MFVDGGPGGDVIAAAVGFDAIDGGPGNDLLHGGAGNDVVEGGDGKDSFSADGASAEPGAGHPARRGRRRRVHGGPDGDPSGPDRGRSGPGHGRLLAQARAGVAAGELRRTARRGRRTAGEGDDIGDDVEVLIGGVGAGLDRVHPRRGRDRCRRGCSWPATPASDRLISDTDIETDFDPGIGLDAVDGSSVGDRVLGRDAEHDDVDCNGGVDAYVADLRDGPLSSECEQVDQGAVNEGPNVVMPLAARCASGATGPWSVRLRCPRKLRIACAGRLAVRLDRSGARFGARERYRIRRGRSVTVRVVLPRGAACRAPGAAARGCGCAPSSAGATGRRRRSGPWRCAASGRDRARAGRGSRRSGTATSGRWRTSRRRGSPAGARRSRPGLRCPGRPGRSRRPARSCR